MRIQVRTDMYRKYHASAGSQLSQEPAVNGQFPDGTLTVEKSASELISQFGKLSLESTGTFRDYKGAPLPW
jgi:hypothetical protein